MRTAREAGEHGVVTSVNVIGRQSEKSTEDGMTRGMEAAKTEKIYIRCVGTDTVGLVLAAQVHAVDIQS